MSRVITFSRFFPATHKRKGEPTYFVEKLCKGFPDYEANDFICLKSQPNKDLFDLLPLALDIIRELRPKYHTIRAGNRWKVGERFSPRVWSAKPYCSPMITIAPDIEIKKVSPFECKKDGTFYLDGNQIDVTSCDLPENDGLSTEDFLEWFKVGKEFIGQVIYWNEEIEY